MKIFKYFFFNIFLSLTFILNLPVFAYAEPVKNYPYKAEYTFFSEQPLASVSVRANDEQQFKLNEYYWLASILFPGSGQILMGDYFRGISFIIVIGLLLFGVLIIQASDIILFLTTIITGNPQKSLLYFAEVFFWILISLVHGFNIIDSYLMSKEPESDY